MIIGKYIKMLLDERKRVILPGFGNLEVIVPESAQAPSGNRFIPPGTRVRFDKSYSKDDGLLAETLASGEQLDSNEAQQRVLELVDAIKFSLDKGEEYLLHEAGSFSRDSEGKIRFLADPDWVLEPEQYGLESMDLLELEDLPIEKEEVKETTTKAAPKVTPLAPPRPKPKPKKWRVIWFIAALLIVVLVVLVIIPPREDESGERRQLFRKKADRELVEQDQPVDEQQEGQTDEQPSDTETVVSEPETEVEQEQSQPPEESNNFFIIAGSFSKLKNASDLQDQLNARGFNAEVMITENRMYRVSVASYATKEEAEEALPKIKSESGLQSCWLLSN
ncbi:MAG: SPOR domain-containing protein [Bacteroidota bacterium]|nr:SPOR domain-containing protein [Bacteroidota bacterium]